MSDWPHRFVTAAAAVGGTSRDLLKKESAAYPFAFAHVVEWDLRAPAGRTIDRQELLAAKSVLSKRGEPPTWSNLVRLVGAKPAALGSGPIKMFARL